MSKIDPNTWWSLKVHEFGYKLTGPEWTWRNTGGPYWRMYANGRSGHAVEFDGVAHPLDPDVVVLMPENMRFHCLASAAQKHLVPHIWIHFSVQPAVRAALTGPIILKRDAGLRNGIGRLLRHKLKLHAPDGKTMPPEGETAPPDAKLYHLCAGLLHECFARAALKVGPAIPQQLRSLLEMIEHSLDHPPSNAFLAGRMGLSVEAFIRMFKRLLNTTPGSYIAERRIQEACRRLTFTDDTLESIAEATGFANRHHFSHAFRKRVGCGPATFRLKR